MTVPATTRRAGPFTGNGVTTSFPFTFKTFDTEDLAVTLTDADALESTLVLDSDYSVTLNGDQDSSPGGSITYPISGTALIASERLTVIGAVDYDQVADLPTGGSFSPVVIENALDRATFQIQQLAEQAGRALTLPPSATADTTLPVPESNKVIGWNEAANALVNLDATDLASVVVAGTSYTDVFDGTGAQVAFALTANPGSVNALDIAISGVSQVNGVDFTVSGTTLTFTSAPPAATGNICVRYVAALPVGTTNAQDVVYDPGGTGGVATTVEAKLRESPISVKDKGAVGDGVADDTLAFQTAVDALGGNPGVILVPPGTYLITSTISITNHRQWLIGAGRWSSVILFVPTVADICIFVGKGGEGTTDGGVIYENAIKNLTFRSTNTALKKTAIEVKDGSLTQIEDVHIGGSTRWVGASSIGVRSRGRDTLLLRNCVIESSLPIVIGYNDNFPTICADHFRFENLQLATRAHLETPPNYATAVVTCEPGITLSNVSFSGYQAWLRGRHGFYYDNSGTAAAGASYGVVFENVRWEGEPGDDDTGYCFYLNHGAVSTINNIRFVNMQAGEIGNGIYLRNFLNADLESCNWQIGARVALNIDTNNGAEVVRVSNCVWTTGCTASIPSAFFLYAALLASNSAPVARTGEYAASTTRRDFYSGGAINEFSVAVAAADPTVVTLPLRSTATVVGILADSRGKYAIVGFNASSKATTLIYNDTNWSVAINTAAKLNVYWDAGSSTYKVQNKTGIDRTLYFQSLGSNQ